MSLNSLRDQAYNTAKEKGWHDQPRPVLESLCLIHSEVSEAVEQHREHRAPNETYYNEGKPSKPEGIPSEMADIVIRVLDFCGEQGIDLDAIVQEKMRYNATRPFRHGNKKA